jgi:hypothetical protein
VRRERRSWLVSDIAADPVLARAHGAAHVAFADAAGRLHHACIAVHAGAWTGRVRRTLVDWMADLGAALLRPFGLAAGLIPGLASSFDRARRELTGAGSRTASAPPSAAIGMGARFVRGAARPAATVAVEPSAAQTETAQRKPAPRGPPEHVRRDAMPPRHMPAQHKLGQGRPPERKPVEPRPAEHKPVEPRPAERKPAISPALEGLPLLESDDGSPRPAVAPAAADAGTPAADRPAAAGARERLELQRIMALAEEAKPQVL